MFDLRNGLAGELFHKFTNYKQRVAIVLPDFEAYGERIAGSFFLGRPMPGLYSAPLLIAASVYLLMCTYRRKRGES
jgi:hypothetical protein